jgi:hypothetical protein
MTKFSKSALLATLDMAIARAKFRSTVGRPAPIDLATQLRNEIAGIENPSKKEVLRLLNGVRTAKTTQAEHELLARLVTLIGRSELTAATTLITTNHLTNTAKEFITNPATSDRDRKRWTWILAQDTSKLEKVDLKDVWDIASGIYTAIV